jgi:hypothetical protein
MEIITSDYFIKCTECKKQVDRYYNIELINGICFNTICLDCLIHIRHGYHPGMDVYLPCKLCDPPKIRWFYKCTYGNHDKKSHCGNHKYNDDEYNDNDKIDLFD